MATWWHRVCGCASASVKNPALGDDTAPAGRRPSRGGGLCDRLDTLAGYRWPGEVSHRLRDWSPGRRAPCGWTAVWRASSMPAASSRSWNRRALWQSGAEVPDDIEDDVWRAHLMVDRA